MLKWLCKVLEERAHKKTKLHHSSAARSGDSRKCGEADRDAGYISPSGSTGECNINQYEDSPFRVIPRALRFEPGKEPVPREPHAQALGQVEEVGVPQPTEQRVEEAGVFQPTQHHVEEAGKPQPTEQRVEKGQCNEPRPLEEEQVYGTQCTDPIPSGPEMLEQTHREQPEPPTVQHVEGATESTRCRRDEALLRAQLDATLITVDDIKGLHRAPKAHSAPGLYYLLSEGPVPVLEKTLICDLLKCMGFYRKWKETRSWR